MELICESDNLDDYLLELNEVDYSNQIIKKKADELFNPNQTEVEKANVAFEFVRVFLERKTYLYFLCKRISSCYNIFSWL